MVKAIARIAKLKGNSLSASELHTSRQRDTPNANPDQPNQRLVGTSLAIETLEQLVRQRIGTQRIRRDAVLCVELLLSVSPEYFRPLEPSRAGHWEVDKLERFQWTVQQWLSDTYGDRIVRAELHLDEATPHIHAYLVPLDERGKLNCKGLFGSREQLRQFQDSYAQALEPLGVERGIRGSRATHTAIQAYYGAVMQQPDRTLEPEMVQYQLADRARALKERDELEQTARALERENAVLRQQVQQQEQTVQQLQAQWAAVVQEVRSLPLEMIAAELGLATDSQHSHQWRSPSFDININGSKFYDWTALKGGGGAIDLVMQVEQCGFQQAVVWLRDRFGEAATLEAVHRQVEEIFGVEPVQRFMPPPANESEWQLGREYLTQTLKLPTELVDRLHGQGVIYVDVNQRIVFLHCDLNGKAVTGATIYSIEAGKYCVVEGSRRSQGWFYLDGKQAGEELRRLVLVNSPIEALSKWVLEQPGQGRSLYLVVNRGMRLPVDLIERSATVVLACGVDATGEALAQQVQPQVAGGLREYSQGESWNQDLQAMLQGKPLKQPQRPVHRDGIEW